jgi:hypothetical protein
MKRNKGFQGYAITIILQIAVAAAEACIFAIGLQIDCSYTILGLHLCCAILHQITAAV